MSDHVLNMIAELVANRTAKLKQYGVSLSGAISYNVQLQDTNCGK